MTRPGSTSPGITLRSASGDPHQGDFWTARTKITARGALSTFVPRRRPSPTSPCGGHGSIRFTFLLQVQRIPDGTKIYNVVLTDAGEQTIKINSESGKKFHANNGEVACSSLSMTAKGRVFVTGRLSSGSRCLHRRDRRACGPGLGRA